MGIDTRRRNNGCTSEHSLWFLTMVKRWLGTKHQKQSHNDKAINVRERKYVSWKIGHFDLIFSLGSDKIKEEERPPLE